MPKEDVMDSVLTIITLDVDLRIKIDHSVKFSHAPQGAKTKTNIRNGQKINKLNRQYELIQLYESFMGQNHKYYVVFWSAYFKMVLKGLEENKFYQGGGKASL